MKSRRGRFRQTCKWLATAIASLILVAWPLSRWWLVSLALPNQRSVSIMSGCLFAGTDPAPVDGEPSVPSGLYFQENLMGELGMFWNFRHVKSRLKEFIVVPLWAPLLVVLLPAAIMWRGDLIVRRRRRAGLCASCGYDRRGLVGTTPCPECGCTQ